MLISNAIEGAMQTIAAREADALHAFDPGAVAQHDDVAAPRSAAYSLDALSSVPPPDALYVVRGGDGRPLYTADGSFTLRDGVLTDAHGNAVLGLAPGSSVAAPLRADTVDTALGVAQDAGIAADGTVSYERAIVDPANGNKTLQRVVLGRVVLARFTAGTRLTPIDAQHSAAPAGSPPHVGLPGDGNFAALRTHARAGSGIDVDRSLQRLQEAYLAFDAVRAAGHAQGDLQKTAMDLLK